ncbi:MAG TPA: hypothetical protein VF136_03950 [Methylomirabilota bacterium]
MTAASGAPDATRPLADPRPFLVLLAVALVAIGGLIWSLFRDPGLPAYVAEDYMRVAGGIVVAEHRTDDPAALSATLARELPGPAIAVPDLSASGYVLEGGRVYEVAGHPGVLAIYHNDLRDLLVYQAWHGSVDELPPTRDVRLRPHRTCYVFQKSTSTLVFWQDGPVVRVLTAGLPTEHVVKIAVQEAAPADPPASSPS